MGVTVLWTVHIIHVDSCDSVKPCHYTILANLDFLTFPSCYDYVGSSSFQWQWGFMTDRSTISALIKVVDDWSKALDQGSEVCVVFFDVSKAFDKVPHLPLIQQLQELYVDPYLIRWLIDYLSNR